MRVRLFVVDRVRLVALFGTNAEAVLVRLEA